MHTRRIMVTAALAAACLSLACTRAVVYKESSPHPVIVANDNEPGPPPHAPAHGYRRNHGDVVLVYDAGIDVYVVSGYDNCYYSSGQYFRFVDGSWEWSVSIEGKWRIVTRTSDLPPGLRHKHGNGKAKGHDKH
jgi:hypothetical protein